MTNGNSKPHVYKYKESFSFTIMVVYTTQADLQFDSIQFGFDVDKLKKSQEAYTTDPKKSITSFDFKYDKKLLRTTLEGELISGEINYSKLYDNYSLGVRLDADACNLISLLQDILEPIAKEFGYTSKDIINNEMIFLKLKTRGAGKDMTWHFKWNEKCTPATYNKVILNRLSNVKARVSFSAYFDHKDEKCGITIKLEELETE